MSERKKKKKGEEKKLGRTDMQNRYTYIMYVCKVHMHALVLCVTIQCLRPSLRSKLFRERTAKSLGGKSIARRHRYL